LNQWKEETKVDRIKGNIDVTIEYMNDENVTNHTSDGQNYMICWILKTAILDCSDDSE
jgi:hypothetical protein